MSSSEGVCVPRHSPVEGVPVERHSPGEGVPVERHSPVEGEKDELIGCILELQNTLHALSQRVNSVKEENAKLKAENQVMRRGLASQGSTAGL